MHDIFGGAAAPPVTAPGIPGIYDPPTDEHPALDAATAIVPMPAPDDLDPPMDDPGDATEIKSQHGGRGEESTNELDLASIDIDDDLPR
jgi:hypothetical protein